MGKNRSKRKRGDTQYDHVDKPVEKSLERAPQSQLKKIPGTLLPPAFPATTHLALHNNKKTFLRNDDPNVKELFQLALDTTYEGLAYDIPPTSKKENWYFHESDIQKAFEILYKYHWFRTDITQPYGLGSPCAKTYVTRCLVGEPGTTYKYLGLRMFAHSWTDDDEASDLPSDLKHAVSVILHLNGQLTNRTRVHLHNLEEKRRERLGIKNSQVVHGRAKFDITLINRMVNTPELKREPTSGEGRCAVSWHADSTLEHYSSIAVYQTILKSTPIETHDNHWSLALRVAPHSEGPSAGAISNDSRKMYDIEAPMLALTLQTGSAYYLLDDFNHHHQHAVIVNDNSKEKKKNDAGIRYASTHRLLREGHNVHFIIERCKNAVSQFHKKGVKIWHSEQLLLTELESEWIRQFYIQGAGHKKNLWMCWKKYMHILLDYWSKLETRTKQTIDLLLLAAEARCGLHHCHNKAECTPTEKSKYQKKLNEKRKKALASMEEMSSRGKTSPLIAESLYDTMIQSLAERATMRQFWFEREADPIFQRLDNEYRPLRIPFIFEHHDSMETRIAVNTVDEEFFGKSPLTGSPSGLNSICHDLEKSRAIYLSK